VQGPEKQNGPELEEEDLRLTKRPLASGVTKRKRSQRQLPTNFALDEKRSAKKGTSREPCKIAIEGWRKPARR